MRILVCGGRDFGESDSEVNLLVDTLGEYYGIIDLLISGGARGADRLAERWANAYNIPIERYEADWGAYGKAAGFIRNKRMIDEGKPELVIAFRGGKGTANMIEQARKAGVKVVE